MERRSFLKSIPFLSAIPALIPKVETTNPEPQASDDSEFVFLNSVKDNGDGTFTFFQSDGTNFTVDFTKKHA